MINFNLLDVLTKKDIAAVRNVEAIPAVISIIEAGVGINFDTQGNVYGINNYKYRSNSANIISNYISGKMTSEVQKHINKFLKPYEINKYINQSVALQRILTGFSSCKTVGDFTSRLSNGANFIVDSVKSVFSKNELNSLFKNMGNNIVNSIKTGVSDSINSIINNTMNSLGLNFVSNASQNVALPTRWGDIIPDRPIMILSMYNTVTGNTYKSCRIIGDFSLDISSELESTEVAGRTGPLVGYSGSNLSFSVSFHIVEDLLLRGTIDENIRVLKDLALPKYQGNRILYPKVKVIIGSEKFLAVVNSVNIERRTDMVDRSGYSIFATANISFQVLGKLNGGLISSQNY